MCNLTYINEERELQARVEAIVQQNREWKQQLKYMEHQLKELKCQCFGNECAKFRTEKPRRKLPKYVFTYLDMLKKRNTPTYKSPVEIVVSDFHDTVELPKEEVALDQDKESVESEQDNEPRYDDDGFIPDGEECLFVERALSGTTNQEEEAPVFYDIGSYLLTKESRHKQEEAQYTGTYIGTKSSFLPAFKRRVQLILSNLISFFDIILLFNVWHYIII